MDKHALKSRILGQRTLVRAYMTGCLPAIYVMNKLGFLLPAASLTCRNLRFLLVRNERGSYLTKVYKDKYYEFQKSQYHGGHPVSFQENVFYRQFRKTVGAKKIRDYFGSLDRHYIVRMKLPRENDYVERQGDLIILKGPKPQTGEKGVLLISYFNAMSNFVALFDLDKIARDYRVVLEPSWWGYCDIVFFFYIGRGLDTLVQAQYKEDYEFIERIGKPFIPLRIGAGDWVDGNLFGGSMPSEKSYDIIMVSSWNIYKRHKVLFAAAHKLIQNMPSLKISLIGYPSGGRTIDDIKAEANEQGVLSCCTFFENIPHSQVASILQASKVCVMLSKAEGANRSIYEAIFSGTPIVIYEGNIGVNRDHVNQNTGAVANDDNLHIVLENMLRDHAKYDPRAWALAHTGYHNATRLLNEKLKELALEAGEPWTTDIVPKKNGPNLLYVNEADRLALEPEYKKLEAYLDLNP